MKPLVATAVAIAAMPVMAQQASPEAPAAEKKLCRMELRTGSIMPAKRICHTKSEWSAIDNGRSKDVHQAIESRSMAIEGTRGG